MNDTIVVAALAISISEGLLTGIVLTSLARDTTILDHVPYGTVQADSFDWSQSRVSGKRTFDCDVVGPTGTTSVKITSTFDPNSVTELHVDDPHLALPAPPVIPLSILSSIGSLVYSNSEYRAPTLPFDTLKINDVAVPSIPFTGTFPILTVDGIDISILGSFVDPSDASLSSRIEYHEKRLAKFS